MLFFRTHVRRYFDFSNVQGEGNFVIFINREILPDQGPFSQRTLGKTEAENIGTGLQQTQRTFQNIKITVGCRCTI